MVPRKKKNGMVICTVIKIRDVFVDTLVRHPYLSQFLSSFAFGITNMYFSRFFLSSFTFKIQKKTYKKSL